MVLASLPIELPQKLLFLKLTATAANGLTSADVADISVPVATTAPPSQFPQQLVSPSSKSRWQHFRAITKSSHLVINSPGKVLYQRLDPPTLEIHTTMIIIIIMVISFTQQQFSDILILHSLQRRTSIISMLWIEMLRNLVLLDPYFPVHRSFD